MKLKWPSKHARRWWRWELILPLAFLLVAFGVIGAEVVYKHGTKYVFAQLGFVDHLPELSHQQNVWLHALEWCESRGIQTAINEKDLDGTPSYYSFQFKPSTFKRFGIKYGLLSKSISEEELESQLSDYNLQRSIVSHMIFDEDIRWSREFPACVRRLGPPPQAETE